MSCPQWAYSLLDNKHTHKYHKRGLLLLDKWLQLQHGAIYPKQCNRIFPKAIVFIAIVFIILNYLNVPLYIKKVTNWVAETEDEAMMWLSSECLDNS